MPVQHRPQIPLPYWQMRPQKPPVIKPITPEYCAICELKQLVDKIGQNLCTDCCTTCNKDGKGNVRPASAVSQKSSPPPPSAPCGDSPMVMQQQQQIPCLQTQQPTKPPSLPCGSVIPTYQWPNYSYGMMCKPQEQHADYYYHIRQHPYLPVKIDTRNEDPTKRDAKLHRSKSANVILKQSAELRSSVLVGCECTKKNGLQDTCPRLVCKDMPRMGTLENPCQLPCKDIPCKPCKPPSIVEEDEDECPPKPEPVQCKQPDPPKAEIEVPAKTVPECKPDCAYPCKEEK